MYLHAISLSLFTFMHWRRKWQPTPVLLPGESQGQGSLVGCCLWGHTESDTLADDQRRELDGRGLHAGGGTRHQVTLHAPLLIGGTSSQHQDQRQPQSQ